MIKYLDMICVILIFEATGKHTAAGLMIKYLDMICVILIFEATAVGPLYFYTNVCTSELKHQPPHNIKDHHYNTTFNNIIPITKGSPVMSNICVFPRCPYLTLPLTLRVT